MRSFEAKTSDGARPDDGVDVIAILFGMVLVWAILTVLVALSHLRWHLLVVVPRRRREAREMETYLQAETLKGMYLLAIDRARERKK